jgi:hypothetical protein
MQGFQSEIHGRPLGTDWTASERYLFRALWRGARSNDPRAADATQLCQAIHRVWGYFALACAQPSIPERFKSAIQTKSLFQLVQHAKESLQMDEHYAQLASIAEKYFQAHGVELDGLLIRADDQFRLQPTILSSTSTSTSMPFSATPTGSTPVVDSEMIDSEKHVTWADLEAMPVSTSAYSQQELRVLLWFRDEFGKIHLKSTSEATSRCW